MMISCAFDIGEINKQITIKKFVVFIFIIIVPVELDIQCLT